MRSLFLQLDAELARGRREQNPLAVLVMDLVGQAWNIMMGFAGQLSLGHALYVGLGGYTAAGCSSTSASARGSACSPPSRSASRRRGRSAGSASASRIAGTYFALLTIAFAEFTRIGFDNFRLGRRLGRLFLRVERGGTDLANLRGGAGHVLLRDPRAGGAARSSLSAWLLRQPAGYYWRAIRENEEAAQALGIDTFRCKMLAVQISAALTALAGVFYAFYYNNLFPEQAFNIARSIEMILAPIIGGIGTLFGPILGAAS